MLSRPAFGFPRAPRGSGMIAFAAACDAIAATPAKLAKVARLAAYLVTLDDADLAAAARFFTGNPFAAAEQRSLSVGGRTLTAAAETVWGVLGAELGQAYRGTGDLGSALARFVRPPLDLGLGRESLSPAGLKAILDEIADVAGPTAGKRRLALCERILRACTSELEARYVLKLLTGELRIGLREGLVVDAIARAFERDPGEARRATMAARDVGAVAVAARHDRLPEVAVRYGAPVGFMLATPIAFGSSYRELATGTWLVEDKYDGVRAQAHKQGAQVTLYSRTHSEIGRSFPEIVATLAQNPGDFILDGEIVAQRDGRVLPFRYLQARLQRKDPSVALRAEVPAAFVAFDVLAMGRALLLDRPFAERRAALEAAIVPSPQLILAPSEALEPNAAPTAVNLRFEQARASGHEGLVFKRSDSPYAAGRRGKWWLKLKRELSTLDVVVVAVEWGHGKRHRVLSDYTFAVREAPGSERLLVIGKAYTGLTDAEIAETTQWFLAHRRGEHNNYALAVEPAIVIEVAFDIIQKSTLHDSEYALRFPRIVRLRPDKSVDDVDTLADVERIYAEMLGREGVER
jgi:DNA ligase 1